MKAGIGLHSLYFMGKREERRVVTENSPVMYPASYYGYPSLATNLMYNDYVTYNIPPQSPKGRDIYNIGGDGGSSSKSSKTLEDIKKKVDSIDKTLKSIEEELKKKL